MSDGKTTKAELAEAVRELREEVARLRAERTAHTCHGHGLCCSHVHCNHGHCGCFTWHYSYTNVAAGAPLLVTYTVTNGGTNVSVAPWATTNVAAGCNPAVTTLSLSN
jgi:hypothetical protein